MSRPTQLRRIRLHSVNVVNFQSTVFISNFMHMRDKTVCVFEAEILPLLDPAALAGKLTSVLPVWALAAAISRIDRTGTSRRACPRFRRRKTAEGGPGQACEAGAEGQAHSGARHLSVITLPSTCTA